MPEQLLLRLVSAGVCIANRAGQVVREVLKSGKLGIIDKGINDPQTEADRSAQKLISSSFLHQFPKVTLIGEEFFDPNEKVGDEWIEKGRSKDVLNVELPKNLDDIKDEDVVIWIDPLDGTAEYTQGLLDHVTVLIGIAVKGVSVAGIVHQPFYNYQLESDPFNTLGRTMWGIVGEGIHGMNLAEPPKDLRILTTTRSHLTTDVTAALEAMQPDQVIRVGGAGHKVLMLIEGKAHAYVFASPGCKKWDTCAPEALLKAAGGRLTDIHGSCYEYHKLVEHRNSRGILATAFENEQDWYLQKVPESVKNVLRGT